MRKKNAKINRIFQSIAELEAKKGKLQSLKNSEIADKEYLKKN